MAQSRTAFTWRELDTVKVLGRDEPVRIYEPLADKNRETQEQGMVASTYAEGLACWRARDFGKAAEWFGQTASIDPASALFAKRADKLASRPPQPDWAPVNTLEGK